MFDRADIMSVELCIQKYIWAALTGEQMSNGWPFSLLNDEQMSNKVGVEHQPDIYIIYFDVQSNVNPYQ